MKTELRYCQAEIQESAKTEDVEHLWMTFKNKVHSLMYTIKDTARQQSTEAMGLQTGEDSYAQEQETVPKTTQEKESQRHQAVQRNEGTPTKR